MMRVDSNPVFRSPTMKRVLVGVLISAIAFLLGRFVAGYSPAIVLLGTVIIPTVLVFFFRPRIGVLGLIAVDYLLGFVASSSMSRQAVAVTGVRFIGLIVFAGWLVAVLLKTERVRLICAPQVVFLILYFFASALSAFFSEYPVNCLMKLQTLGMQITLYLIVVSVVDSPVMVGRIVWTMVLVGVASTLVGIHQLSFSSIIRLEGTLQNANTFALGNIIFLSLTLSQLRNVRSLAGKFLLAVLVAFLAFSIVASGSRAGLITLGLTIVLFLVRFADRLRDATKDILVLSSIGILVFILIRHIGIPDYSRTRILDIPSPIAYLMDPRSIKEGSARERATQLQIAKRMFSSNPLLGLGPGSYIEEEGYYFFQLYGYNPRDKAQTAHNIYIALLTERGILGTVPFLLLIWFTLREFERAASAFKKRGNSKLLNWTRGIEISFISILFFGLSSATELQSKYLFIAMALAPVLRSLSTDDASEKSLSR